MQLKNAVVIILKWWHEKRFYLKYNFYANQRNNLKGYSQVQIVLYKKKIIKIELKLWLWLYIYIYT